MQKYANHPLASVLMSDSSAAMLQELLEDSQEEALAAELFGAASAKRSSGAAGSAKLSGAMNAAVMLRKRAVEDRVGKARVLMAERRAVVEEAAAEKRRKAREAAAVGPWGAPPGEESAGGSSSAAAAAAAAQARAAARRATSPLRGAAPRSALQALVDSMAQPKAGGQ